MTPLTQNLIDPASWKSWSPAAAIAPAFEALDGRLVARGNGNPQAFGRWQRRIPVRPGQWYQFRVAFQPIGNIEPNTHVLAVLSWRKGDRADNQCPQEYVPAYRSESDLLTGELRARSPADADSVEIHLYFRFSAEGGAAWHACELLEAEPLPSRPVKLFAVKSIPSNASNLDAALRHWGKLLDAAAAEGADLAILPEAINVAGQRRTLYQAAEPIPGPTFNLLASKARETGMWVSGCFYELDGDHVYNTAVLLNRKGELIGTYRKTHPYWPEEVDGCSPGDAYPVYDTEFGRVGIIICYDSWYPETMRILALRGADLVLFPNWGYEPKLIPARAIDNGVYIAVSSIGSPAMLVDTCGNILAERQQVGSILATVDLAHRPSPHSNAGGACNASPGGRRAMRNAASFRLYEEIQREVRRWEDVQR